MCCCDGDMGAQGSKGETSASMASLKDCLKIGNQGQEDTASDDAGDETESEVYFEEHSSPLMSLDDFVLIKLISFLDGPTLLSVMLTCKRLQFSSVQFYFISMWSKYKKIQRLRYRIQIHC